MAHVIGYKDKIYPNRIGGGGGGGSSAIEKGLSWDFTESVLDKNTLERVALTDLSISSNGLVFANRTSFASFNTNLLRKYTTFEIEISSMDIQSTSEQHNRLIYFKNVGGDQNAGFGFRYQTQVWSVWDSTNGWQDSNITDKNFFNDCVLKLEIQSDGNWKIYKDDVLAYTTTSPVVFEGTGSWGLGSPNQSATNMTIKSMRAYVTGHKEEQVAGGGGGASLTEKPCYIEFKTGWKNNFIDTGLGQMDAEIFLDFYIDGYQNDKAILGNSSGLGYVHLTMYSNKWYTSNGSGEFSFGDSTMITGRHTFLWNRTSDRKILFDNTEVGTTNGTENGDIAIRLNNRNGNMCCYKSRIYEFKITARDGTILHHFKPVAIYQENDLIWKGIRDEVGGMQLTGWYDIVEIE